jgi:spermidine/putrescine transport system permease protein
MSGRSRLRRRIVPYALLAPGVLWLLVFYVYPAIQVLAASFWSGSVERGFTFSLSNWTNYPSAVALVVPHFGRSLAYAFAATVLTFLIAYPLAYTMAIRAGRFKNLLLFLVVAPFFTNFLLRTISWKIILGDHGVVLGPLKDLGLVPDEFRVLATAMAVVAGITYNFLPFMTLPIYVSLEKLDRGLIDAARDLYAGPWRPGGAVAGGLLGGLLSVIFGWSVLPVGAAAAIGFGFIGWRFVSQSFIRVTLPLSLPGVFAGTLLTFIPAVGDYINAELLGNPDSRMIGNVIQNRFLVQNDYAEASALSFILMVGVLGVVLLYSRLLGTTSLTTGRTI